MIPEARLKQAKGLIDPAKRVLITTHIKPDGDACGSLAAMVYALRSAGKQVLPLVLTDVPDWYGSIIPGQTRFLGKDIDLRGLSAADYDLLILVDVNSLSQLTGLEDLVSSARQKTLVIDHHATSDGLGSVELVDTSAAATGMIVLELVRFARWPVTDQMAEALFVAIATDTGWFHYSNTDGRVLRACAELVDAGVSPARMYARLYQQFSYPRFMLMLRMLNSLRLHFDGRLALMSLARADFQRTKTSYNDTENLINEAYRISSVIVSCLLVEMEDGRIHCSLRSRSPNHASPSQTIDVSRIAATFGGGGHKNAAGVFLDGPMEMAIAKVLSMFEPYLNQQA